MCEAWEDILMQMDLRLTKFVQVSGRDSGSISAEMKAADEPTHFTCV